MSAEKNQMYFAVNPDAAHDEHVVDYHVADVDLKFNTDAGVFSKMRVDYGSGVLIKAMHNVTFPDAGILDVGDRLWSTRLICGKVLAKPDRRNGRR